MKTATFNLFAIQNQPTGALVSAATNSSPMFYKSAALATAAMGARGWSFKRAQEHEVVPVTITVGASK